MIFMKEQYQEIYEDQICPLDGRRAVHMLWITKSTCTRCADEVLDFSCSLDDECRECISEYP